MRAGEMTKYVMMGEDGFYTFEDRYEDLARIIGQMSAQGFVLIGIDGLNGFKVDPRPQAGKEAPRG